MFYNYRQNNSGGSFDFNKEHGIANSVVIEAESLDEANLKASEIGIYFDGCSKGIDCSCCGDRWYEPCDQEGDKEPMHYGEKIDKKLKIKYIWSEKGFEICVHYKDGSMEWF